LAGSFTKWQGIPMQLINGFWQETIQLMAGQYPYKFIVDGNWKYDPSKSIFDDGAGNINNLLIVGSEAQGSPVVVQAPVKKDSKPTAPSKEPVKPVQEKKSKPESSKPAKPSQSSKPAKPESLKPAKPAEGSKPEDQKKKSKDQVKPGEAAAKPPQKKEEKKKKKKIPLA